MKPSAPQPLAIALVSSILMLCAGCSTTGADIEEGEVSTQLAEAAAQMEEEPAVPDAPDEEALEDESEGEVSLAVAELEEEYLNRTLRELDEVVIEASRERHEIIRHLVAEARTILHDVELDYVFTGKGKKEVLRGRPVAFALWSEAQQDWSVVQVEIPRPPVKWKPGRKPFPFRLLTPGFEARHVKGTGAERLMFAFSRNGEQLKVYGRKFPVFDSGLIKKKKWRAVAETAQPIVYLPFTDDTLDPALVAGGTEHLLGTANRAIQALRAAYAPSMAYPGEMLADVVPAEVIATLAVIEQTDDTDFVNLGDDAFNQVLNQYGLKRDEAYRYSVSSASAIGPMQFTNRRGNGTYALVVRRCPAARIDPDFERGATNLLNAMKAAICLFDIELAQMRADIRSAYHDNPRVLGIFPVAAYNGGPRNVTRLFNVTKRLKVQLADLRPPDEQPPGKPVACPCLWKETDSGVLPVSIPRYNNENRWYIEKYQRILESLSEANQVAAEPASAP